MKVGNTHFQRPLFASKSSKFDAYFRPNTSAILSRRISDPRVLITLFLALEHCTTKNKSVESHNKQIEYIKTIKMETKQARIHVRTLPTHVPLRVDIPNTHTNTNADNGIRLQQRNRLPVFSTNILAELHQPNWKATEQVLETNRRSHLQKTQTTSYPATR